jgi:RNA polymerase sigma-70 factor (ECF subfamily)
MEAASKHRVDSAADLGQPAEADLFVRIRSGDERAFEELFRAYARELCRHAYHYLESAELAEDVVQDVLLRIWEHRLTLAHPIDLRAYLHTAVRNRALDAKKAARSTARTYAAGRNWVTGSAIGMGEAPSSPVENAERSEISAALRTAIRQLPERCRLVFALRWESHLSYAQIAEQLGVSIKAVERHRQRGLKRLARSLRRFFP